MKNYYPLKSSKGIANIRKVENGAYHSCAYVRKRYAPAYHCENAVANIVHAEAKK